jgi:hypothetical protein
MVFMANQSLFGTLGKYLADHFQTQIYGTFSEYTFFAVFDVHASEFSSGVARSLNYTPVRGAGRTKTTEGDATQHACTLDKTSASAACISFRQSAAVISSAPGCRALHPERD